MPNGILDNTRPMPAVDPDDSKQNAFVQDWLIAWAKKYTVYDSEDWEEAANAKHQTHKERNRAIRDAHRVETMVELIQETYGDRC